MELTVLFKHVPVLQRELVTPAPHIVVDYYEAQATVAEMEEIQQLREQMLELNVVIALMDN
jgi:hypothetical protein